MGNLVCAKDVKEFAQQGETVFRFERGTIITPSAWDMAAELGVSLVEQNCLKQSGCGDGCQQIGSGQIYQVLKQLMEKGLLDGMFEPYESVGHKNGLKVIRGDTVKMEAYNTGIPGTKVYCQELVNKKESNISAGFLMIDHSEFRTESACGEINYVMEGVLNVTIEGRMYTAYAGDVLLVPSGSEVIRGALDKVRIFYASCPTGQEASASGKQR